MYPVFLSISILYLILHVAPCLIHSPYLWGVDAWSYIPLWLALVFFLTGLAGFMPGVRRGLRKPLFTAGSYVARIPLPVAVILAGGLMFLFSQRTFFLGDGRLRMLSTELGFMFAVEEPFDTLLHGIAYRALGPAAGLSGRDVYRLISIVAGMSALWGGAYFIRRLYTDRAERWTAGLLLATCGAVQLFFGYAESYTVAAALILLYLFAAVVMVRHGRYSIVPAILLSSAAAFHPLSVMLFPGAVYAYYKVIHDSGGTAGRILAPAGIVLGAAGVVVTVFHIGGTPAGEFIGHYLSGGNMLPLFRRGDLYGILSPGHLLDMANELWLTAPSVAALVFIAGKGKQAFMRQPGTRFLILSSAGLLVFMLLFHPRLGFARDWDLFSVAAFPLTLLAVEAVVGLGKEGRYRAAVPLVLMSLLHTAPWLGLNASEEMSVVRFATVSNNPSWSIHARELAFNELAMYYQARGRLDDYFTYAEKTFRLRKNRKYFGELASKYYKNGRPDALAALAASDESNPEGWFYVGVSYQDRGDFENAQAMYDLVRSLDPAFPGIHLQQGQLFIATGRISEAIPELERGLARFDSFAENPVFKRIGIQPYIIRNNLGLCYLKTGRTADAIIQFTAALAGHPEYHQAHYNLAVAYLKAGKREDAARHAELARQYGHDRGEVDALERVIRGQAE